MIPDCQTQVKLIQDGMVYGTGLIENRPFCPEILKRNMFFSLGTYSVKNDIEPPRTQMSYEKAGRGCHILHIIQTSFGLAWSIGDKCIGKRLV